MGFSRYLGLALGLIVGTNAGAQDRGPIRQLGAVVAKSTEPIANNSTVRPSASGVLVNDVVKRRVIFFDSALAKFVTVADTTSDTGNAYPKGLPGGLIGFKGDSSLFFDAQSLSMLVIDPAGKVARVMSLPSSQDGPAMMMGGTAYDGRGNIIYRAGPFGGGMRLRSGGPMGMPEFPDSVPLMRIDMATRVRDTLAWVRIQKVKMEITHTPNGGMSMTSQINPLPTVDEFAVLPDGSVAVIRGKDYHIDFVYADGSKVSAAKIPFDWQRLTDEDKIALMDSVKAARERMIAANPPVTIGGAGGPQISLGGSGGGGGGPMISMQIGPGGPGGAPGAGRAAATAAQMTFVPPSDLPDYKPPFFAGASRADTEGNIWIRTIPTKAIAGGPVYDVINRKGELVERVQIPVNSSIIGFGPNGAVYMTVREGDNTFLQKARVR